MINEVNKAINEAREKSIWSLEIVAQKDSLNKLLAEFAELGYIKEEAIPKDGDFIEAIRDKMIDNIVGQYRAVQIRLVENLPSGEDIFLIREKESLKVLCEIQVGKEKNETMELWGNYYKPI